MKAKDALDALEIILIDNGGKEASYCIKPRSSGGSGTTLSLCLVS